VSVTLRAVHGELVAPSAWHVQRPDLVALILPAEGYVCVAARLVGSKTWRRWTSSDGAAWKHEDGGDARTFGAQLRQKLEGLADPGKVAALGALRGTWRAEVSWPGGTMQPPSVSLSRKLTTYAEIQIGGVQAPGKLVWTWRTVGTRSGPWVRINHARTTEKTLADALRNSISQTIELTVKPSCAARDTQPRTEASRGHMPMTHDPASYPLDFRGAKWATDGSVAVRKGSPVPKAAAAWYLEEQGLEEGPSVLADAIRRATTGPTLELYPAKVRGKQKGSIFLASEDGRRIVGVAARMGPVLQGGRIFTASPTAPELAPLVVLRGGEPTAIVMPYRYETPPAVEKVQTPKEPKAPKARPFPPKPRAEKAPKAPPKPKAEKPPKAPPKPKAEKAPKAPPKPKAQKAPARAAA
jgi:hypothetical protein